MSDLAESLIQAGADIRWRKNPSEDMGIFEATTI
jgi:hypothetical protein